MPLPVLDPMPLPVPKDHVFANESRTIRDAQQGRNKAKWLVERENAEARD